MMNRLNDTLQSITISLLYKQLFFYSGHGSAIAMQLLHR